MAITGYTQLWGGSGNDTITLHLPTIDLAHKLDNTQCPAGQTTCPAALVNGTAAEAALGRVRTIEGVTGLPDRNMVDVDGQGGNDAYTVDMSGTAGNPAGADYIVRIHDNHGGGAPTDVNTLTINGLPNADNIFLLQQLFVALVHPASSGTGFAPDYERVNYDNSINLLQVNGGALSDQFYVDDNSAITVLDGVAGNDTFQFGQVFGTDPTAATAVAPGDEIATVDTTVGWLSRGVSYATTAYAGAIPVTGAFYQLTQADGSGNAAGLYQWNGAAWVPSTSTAPGGTPSGTALPGRGDATFTVYSNKATLKLFGEGGNNTFIVRAFLIITTGQSATSQTDITTGNGNNQIEYNINAPVAIDGGSGFNTLLIIGTDANDTFVITKDGIMGAGLNVSYTNIEKIEVDGEGGNDTFDVLSTDPDAVTVLEGGSGSNTFNVVRRRDDAGRGPQRRRDQRRHQPQRLQRRPGVQRDLRRGRAGLGGGHHRGPGHHRPAGRRQHGGADRRLLHDADPGLL